MVSSSKTTPTITRVSMNFTDDTVIIILYTSPSRAHTKFYEYKTVTYDRKTFKTMVSPFLVYSNLLKTTIKYFKNYGTGVSSKDLL